MTSDQSSSRVEQQTLAARPRKQVTEPGRDGRKVVCPDCGAHVGHSRGGHELPDGRKVHGWRCKDCDNVPPAKCHNRDAPGWNDSIVGRRVEFRDGRDRWVPMLRSSVEAADAE